MKSWIIATVLSVAISTQAELIIGDLEADYTIGSMATGWWYGWNATGVSLTDGSGMLNDGSFTALVSSGKSFVADVTAGTANYTNALNSAQEANTQLKMNGTADGTVTWCIGGNDAVVDSGTGSTDGLDHYLIMQYTVQTGEGNLAWATDYETRLSGSMGGDDRVIQVFKNGTLVTSGIHGNAIGTQSLGLLADGDVITFAVNGDADESRNSNRWYPTAQIVAIPEPATLGLVAACGAGILFIRRRFML
ncbi:PEP-CTERM sorting domain-containing protein [Pontiella agarivorans]|uniref:PEP-CTERM sorting domain-containing protein n=1 Tax=Pontiella agarivorans TaxID=3038953 RepID=A0ABU5MX54_9BACT|nr:PEP-CTERM sorting domain-containing protein [Pontiella agarivorans]MDZ8118782.1 PEP-CTERM sorting domain-containing protein [Pontiella agarivorans]